MSQTTPLAAHAHASAMSVSGAAGKAGRSPLAGAGRAALTALVVAPVTIAGWGLLGAAAHGGHHHGAAGAGSEHEHHASAAGHEHHAATTAAIGQDVPLGDGIVRVERAGDEAIGQMPMAMSGPGMTEHGSAGKMPMIPKGKRRVGVDITLHAPAGSNGLPLRRNDFWVTAADAKPIKPAGAELARSFVPSGTRLTSTFAFTVPRKQKRLQLHVRGAELPIELTLGKAPATGHHH